MTENMLPVSEVFVSIQGEGPNTGVPTIFLRLMGCNFAMEGHACKWCDSKYAGTVDENTFQSIDQIRENINRMTLRTGIQEVCLTGGEPLYHSVQELTSWLSSFHRLTVQTNGSYLLWQLGERGSWAMDIKCPSSGNSEFNKYENFRILSPKDSVKFVIQTMEDFEFAKSVLNSNPVVCQVFFQPAWKLLPLGTLWEWVLQDSRMLNQVRVGTQLHKVAYPKRVRGV